ncbi:MAG TPA: hypothetical protein VEP50_06500 [bacterium]|nr:hypothetical protein [bacterium]
MITNTERVEPIVTSVASEERVRGRALHLVEKAPADGMSDASWPVDRMLAHAGA